MILENHVYLLKEEFFKELKISEYQYKMKKDDLFQWLKEFYVYEILEGKPLRIHIKSIIGEYRPLPRKGYDIQLQQQKEQEYSNFTIAALGTEWKPNSKSKIARDAIADFGEQKYGHISKDAVARRYVGPTMEQYGEKSQKKYWVWYYSYEPIDDDTLRAWRKILEEEHISEKEAAEAFYQEQQGQDISKQKQYYKSAQDRFKKEYGDIVVLVSKWKLSSKDKKEAE